METNPQARVKTSGLALTSSSCKSHYTCLERGVVSLNSPANTTWSETVEGRAWFPTRLLLLFPSPAAGRPRSSLPTTLQVFWHSLVPHTHIKATGRAGEGTRAPIAVSRQTCIWSTMLNRSLSTCHIRSCPCRYACFERKVYPPARNSSGQRRAS